MDNESKQRADEIVDQIKELVKKGNIARIYVKRGEDTVLNIPLNVGIVGTILGLTAAPWALIASAIATLRWAPPVQPTAITSRCFPSSL